jgi:RNA recognition motif-containing protein
MANKLFVGSLSYNSTEQSLRDAFAQAGTVLTATIITDRMTGRSKGFGFVEMGTDAEAQAAIAMWNGKDLDGRTLIVNEARPKEDRPRGAGGFGGGSGGGGRRFGGGGGGGHRGGGRNDFGNNGGRDW